MRYLKIGLIFIIAIALVTANSALSVTLVHCQKVYGAVGIEDIVIDHVKHIAYLSSQDRRAKPLHGGKIYYMTLDAKQTKLMPMQIDNPSVFHPHGISLYSTKEGNYLYVVNHRTALFHTIEEFKIEGERLLHLNSYHHVALTDPNSVHVVGLHQFYVTNFSANNIWYFNGETWQDAYQQLPYANGITGLHHDRDIYAISTRNRQLVHFVADKSKGNLTKRESYSLGMYGDNIRADEHGNLWIAGHRNGPRFLVHEWFANTLSPSRILVMQREPQGITLKSQTLLDDDGDYLSTSSVASPHQNQLLVGTVYEPYILRCTFAS